MKSKYFDNDDALHAPPRRQVEQMRNELLGGKKNGADCEKLPALLKRSQSNADTETTWQFAARPAETNAPAADEIEIKKRLGPDAQLLSLPRAGGKEAKFYFEDLPGELPNGLRVQLNRPGDVSAVIETPGGFLLYVSCARQAADEVLSAAPSLTPSPCYEP